MGFQVKSQQERASLSYKTTLVKVSFTSAVLASYFYWRHNEYCEPYVYSMFAVCEYIIVVSNMIYHGLAALDFHDEYVRVGTDTLPLR